MYVAPVARRRLWVDGNFSLGIHPPIGHLDVCRDIWRETSMPDRKRVLRELLHHGGAVRINGAPLDWFECEVCLNWIPIVDATKDDSRRTHRCCTLCTEALRSICDSE